LASNRHTISNLQRATDTYRSRNRVYGNNYKRFGKIMQALYPDGVTLKTEHQWNRFGIIIQLVSKLSRYVTDPLNGHLDSIHDMGVYSFMLEELDAEQAGMDIKSPVAGLVTTVNRKEVLPNPCEHVYRKFCYHDEQQCDPECKATHKSACINCGEEEQS
jgi:hypothetical protein